MIVNSVMIHPALLPFQKLEHAPFDVHQTGSRYIGFHKPESDWDFVAQDTPEAQEWLAAAGFKDSELFALSNYEEEGDTDGFTTAVKDAWAGGIKVQVQLTQDLAAKLWARDYIKQTLAETHASWGTKKRIALWKSLCTAYQYNVGAGDDTKLLVPVW